jgi:predicted ATPase
MHYNLTIGLYDAASEALYVTGDFSRLAALVDKPLKFARTFEDKLNIYNNLVRSFLASGQLDQGIASCMRVLVQLGEELPAQITSEVFHVEVIRIKTLLEGMTNDQLLSLPIMTDTNKLVSLYF